MPRRKVVRYEFLPREPVFTPLEALSLASKRHQDGVTSCAHYPTLVGKCAHIAACNYGFANCGAEDAISLWRAIPNKYRRHGIERMREAPAGALLFWSGGTEGHGHAGISDGRGNVVGTDKPVEGRIGRVPVDRIHADWGHTPEGWTFPFFELAIAEDREPPKVHGHERRRGTPNIGRFIASQHNAIAAAKKAIVARDRAEADQTLHRLIHQSREQITLAKTLRRHD